MTVLIGGGLGSILKQGLKERYQEILMQALGLSVLLVGLTGSLKGLIYVNGASLESKNLLVMVFSLTLGALLGEWLKIEERLVSLAGRFRSLIKFELQSERFVEGFVSTTIIICVGGMAIIGPMQDALLQDASMLYTKAVLDGIICLIIASNSGIGVVFAAIPMALYQGGFTVLAALIEPYLREVAIVNLSFVGSLLICCIGINMLWQIKIKVANFLPALLFAVLITELSILLGLF